MEESDLEKIAGFAELQFTPEQIAVIMEIEPKAFEEPDVEKAFYRGRLRAQAEVRAQIKQLAIQGSTPAQKQFLTLVEESAYLDAHDT